MQTIYFHGIDDRCHQITLHLESLGIQPSDYASLSKSIQEIQTNEMVDYETLFVPPMYMTEKMFSDRMAALQLKLEMLSNAISAEEVNASFCENQLVQLDAKPRYLRTMTRGCPNYREIMIESLENSEKKGMEYAKEMAETTFAQVKLYEHKPIDLRKFYQEVIPLLEELRQLGKQRQNALKKMYDHARLKALSAKLRK
jgi:hypothetical protein